MILIKSSDIFSENVEALVNPVNCVGVMGAGLAKRFKELFPENFTAYYLACKAGMVELGKVFVFDVGSGKTPRYILNFPTKIHWMDKSSLAGIEKGLYDLSLKIQKHNIMSVAIPAIGAGLGGLQWRDVKVAIMKILSPLHDVKIIVLEPREGRFMLARPLDK